MKQPIVVAVILLLATSACGLGTGTVFTPTEPPIVQSTPEPTITPSPTPIDLPDTVQLVTDQVPVPPGRGLWRVYDEEAQVVCYIYGANSDTLAWSGLSCLPVSQTALTGVQP